VERERATKTRLGIVRTHLLAVLGAGELTVHAVGGTVARARARMDDALGMAVDTYAGLADRGEHTLRQVTERPSVAQVLANVAAASDRIDRRVELVVDDVHDASEEALGRVSLRTLAARERAARMAREAAAGTLQGLRG
jgi:hypothetical protein